MQVDIVTPEKVLFTNNDVPMVTVPGIEGQMGILDNHAPIVTFLRPGVINVENKGNKYFFTSGGVVDFKNNVLSILCQDIYDIKELTDDKINQLKNNAKNKIKLRFIKAKRILCNPKNITLQHALKNKWM